MELKKPPKNYYRLEDIAAKWGWPVNDLLDYADMGILKICVLASYSNT